MRIAYVGRWTTDASDGVRAKVDGHAAQWRGAGHDVGSSGWRRRATSAARGARRRSRASSPRCGCGGRCGAGARRDLRPLRPLHPVAGSAAAPLPDRRRDQRARSHRGCGPRAAQAQRARAPLAARRRRRAGLRLARAGAASRVRQADGGDRQRRAAGRQPVSAGARRAAAGGIPARGADAAPWPGQAAGACAGAAGLRLRRDQCRAPPTRRPTCRRIRRWGARPTRRSSRGPTPASARLRCTAPGSARAAR